MIAVACTCLWWTIEHLVKGYFASEGADWKFELNGSLTRFESFD
jgi:hypothetical protein